MKREERIEAIAKAVVVWTSGGARELAEALVDALAPNAPLPSFAPRPYSPKHLADDGTRTSSAREIRDRANGRWRARQPAGVVSEVPQPIRRAHAGEGAEGTGEAMNDEWIWSGDEENWSGWGAGEFDTREEAIADACEELEPDQTFWTGRKTPPEPPHVAMSANRVASVVLDHFREETMPGHGDYSFDPYPGKPYLADVSAGATARLGERIKAAFGEWIDAEGLAPTWFCIADSEEHTVPTEVKP